MLNWNRLLEFDPNSNTFVVLIRLNFRHDLAPPYIELINLYKTTHFYDLLDMDVMFLLPLTMESFALEPVGIFLFYLTLLLRILEELRQKRP